MVTDLGSTKTVLKLHTAASPEMPYRRIEHLKMFTSDESNYVQFNAFELCK